MSILDNAELKSLTLKDPLAFGITYVDLLDNKQWSINDRKWIVEPYLAVNPYLIEKYPARHKARKVAFTKSTQAGITTMAMVKLLHFATNWPVRIMDMLPRQKDLSDFSSTRLDPVIDNSTYLAGLRGQPDSVYTKKLGNSYIFMLEGSVEPRSMPADALILDEVDLCNPDYVGTAINRLDASNWKLIYYLSTPTLPLYGIDSVYLSSDMREWVVPCPHCGNKQPMNWDDNIRIIGDHNAPDRVFYGCAKCDKEITIADVQTGEWVAQKPSLSDDMLGYHISQMMTTPAPIMWQHFRDPNQSIAEFYRKRLGRPYTIEGGSLVLDDFLESCFDEEYLPEVEWDGQSTYFIGCDQGNQLQLVVGKLERNSKRIKIVHIELVPFEAGFGRVAELMRSFHVKKAVIDGDPNRHSVSILQKAFTGRILMADYSDQRERFKQKKTGDSKYFDHVTVNRTDAFDDLVTELRGGLFSLPGSPSRRLQEVNILIDQMTSIKRDIEKRKTMSGEIEVGVWRKLRADHLAHAMLYLKTAIDISNGRQFRAQVINGDSPKSESTDDDEDTAASQKEQVVAITAALAEVPNSQLKDYIINCKSPDWLPIFPLSVKLKRLRPVYTEDDIISVAKLVANNFLK